MLTEKTFRPAGRRDCQFGLAMVNIGDALDVGPDLDRDGGYVIENIDGDPVGYLSARHWVSIDLEAGLVCLHASVNSIGEDAEGNCTITVRVVTGDATDVYPAPIVSLSHASHQLSTPFGNIGVTAFGPSERPSVGRTYRVGIVGESYRQPAIRRCAVGDEVLLLPDPDNPYDRRAIAAFARDQQIGFLPRGGWLTEVILDQGADVTAMIGSMAPGGGGHWGVVLEVRW